MKKLIPMILLLASTAFAAEGDRFIVNPNQDKDIVIRVNDGGVNTDAITIDGATASTLLPAGSATVPSFGWAADADGTGTGIYRSAANAIAFTTNGVSRGTVSATGPWTIGSTGLSGAITHTMNLGNSGGTLTINSSAALANNEATELFLQNNGTSGFGAGVYKHAGITNYSGYLSLRENDGATMFFWADNSDNFRVSSSASNIGTTGGVVVGTQTSDQRLKENIVTVPYGLSTVMALQPRKFNRISTPGMNELGFVAQEVQALVPEVVYNTNDTRDGDGHENVLAMSYEL